MTGDTWDQLAQDADLLVFPILTGTLRSRRVELGPDDPRYPDAPEQMAERIRRAHRRATEQDDRRRTYFAAQRAFGHPSRYPDVEQTYRSGDVWDEVQREATIADLCNELHALDPERFSVEYLSDRYNVTPRSPR